MWKLWSPSVSMDSWWKDGEGVSAMQACFPLGLNRPFPTCVTAQDCGLTSAVPPSAIWNSQRGQGAELRPQPRADDSQNSFIQKRCALCPVGSRNSPFQWCPGDTWPNTEDHSSCGYHATLWKVQRCETQHIWHTVLYCNLGLSWIVTLISLSFLLQT